MDLGLDERRVLVAGASRGIGRGIARGFLAEGARVFLTGRDGAQLEATRAALAETPGGAERVGALAADMTATTGIEGAFEAHAAAFGGPPDVLVANVGGGYLKPGWDVADDDLADALEHNLTGTIRLVREGVRRMRRDDDGGFVPSIVVISSIAGVDVMGAPFAYGVAKSGLNHFVGSMARLVGPGMRVNAVAPGNILFEGGSWERNRDAAPERIERWIRREVALGRFGRVEEIADVVTFLSSPRAGFVTGVTWIADGGQVRSSA